MLMGIVSLLTIMLGVFGIIMSFARINISDSYKVSSACSALFLIAYISVPALYSFMLFKLIVLTCIIALCCFLGSSNHFILSLDIAALFNQLILILHNRLKLPQIASIQ